LEVNDEMDADDVGELVKAAVIAVVGLYVVVYLITHLPW
jgi:hypothetical protein